MQVKGNARSAKRDARALRMESETNSNRPEDTERQTLKASSVI